MHNFGVISCNACACFFRRSIQLKYIECHRNCIITITDRTNCQFCRYKKCLSVGMDPTQIRKKACWIWRNCPYLISIMFKNVVATWTKITYAITITSLETKTDCYDLWYGSMPSLLWYSARNYFGVISCDACMKFSKDR